MSLPIAQPSLLKLMSKLAPNRLYSAAGDGFRRPGNGFVQSEDGGQTWHRPDEGLDYHYLWSVAAGSADPNTLVVSAAPGPHEAHNSEYADSAIYRRSGKGPWKKVQKGLPPSPGMLASVVAVNNFEPGVFYVANNKGLFRSADAGGRTAPLASLLGIAGALETAGGALLLVGLFTRPVAFLLSGEMAVAYFTGHAGRGFWPVLNGGVPAILFAFVWIYISAVGAGPWSIDALRSHRAGAASTVIA